MLVLFLEVLNILLGDLDVTLKLKNVDEVLSLISKLLFEVLDLLESSWVFDVGENVKEHSILI